MEHNKITIMLNETDTKRFKEFVKRMKGRLAAPFIYKEVIELGVKSFAHKHNVEGMKDAPDNL